MNTAPETQTTKHRWLIFLVSLGIKLPLAYIFFGSIDIQTWLEYTVSVFDSDGSQALLIQPWFPTFLANLWLAGALNAMTELPVAFSYKIIPILFDAMLAVLVYDFALRRGNRQPLLAGMLYATMPVAVIINSFHVQYDSILIYFLMAAVYVRKFYPQKWKPLAVSGGLFICSVMVKPATVIFLPFLMVPSQRGAGLAGDAAWAFLRPNLQLAAGMVGALAVFALGFVAFGINPFSKVVEIAQYANIGAVIFGLPAAWPFSELSFLRARLWIVDLVIVVAYFYFRGRIGLTDSVVLVFMLIMGLAGIAPQYLIWPLPFLLATERFRAVAVFGLAAAVFLPLFYMNSTVSMGTYATLTAFEWAMPPAHLSQPALALVVLALGNYVIPLLALAIVVAMVRRFIATTPTPTLGRERTAPDVMVSAIVFPALVCLVVLSVYLLASPVALDGSMADLIKDRLSDYALYTDKAPFIGTYGEGGPFNVVYVGLTLSLAWSIAAGLGSRPRMAGGV